MKARSLLVLTSTLALILLAAAPALAGDNGEGLLGETDDKQVTFVSFGVILFFVLVPIVGTLIQAKLEKRKERKKAAQVRGRIGW